MGMCVKFDLERCSSSRGIRVVPFFVVTAGGVEIVRPSSANETLVALYGPGQFTGEVNMLSGRRALLQVRASEAGEVIEVDREQLLALVQTDSELSEIIMRAFILRRVELIAHGLRRCRAGRVELLLGDAARQGIPDAQRPSVLVHRSRSRRRRSGSAGSVSRHRRGCAGC